MEACYVFFCWFFTSEDKSLISSVVLYSAVTPLKCFVDSNTSPSLHRHRGE